MTNIVREAIEALKDLPEDRQEVENCERHRIALLLTTRIDACGGERLAAL